LLQGKCAAGASVTKVQVASNNTEDADLLVEALPNLKERTDLETLYTDTCTCTRCKCGGYGSTVADQTLQDNRVEQIQTAIRGRAPSTEKLNLADFKIKQAESGTPTQITCPQEQIVAVQRAAKNKVLWLTLRERFVGPVLSFRNVWPNPENETPVFICASVRSRSICPNVDGGAWTIKKKGVTYRLPLRVQSTR
jgi:hypothetical protein